MLRVSRRSFSRETWRTSLDTAGRSPVILCEVHTWARDRARDPRQGGEWHMRLDRRQALVLLGSGAASRAGRAEAKSGVSFQHGVASGDPLQDRVMLWTRITAR